MGRKSVRRSKSEEGRPPFSLVRLVKSCVLTAAAVFCVVYAATYLAMRTDGFKSYVEEKLQDRMGMKVKIGRVGANFRLDLVLQDLSGATLQTDAATTNASGGFTVGRVEISWAFPGRVRRLVVEDSEVSFRPGPDGEWEPAALRQFSQWLAEWGGFDVGDDVASKFKRSRKTGNASVDNGDKEVEQVGVGSWDGLVISVNNAWVGWFNSDGESLASASGVEFTSTPVSVPGREIVHYHLGLKDAVVARGRRVSDFHFEALQTGGNTIVLGCQGDWGRDPGGIPAASGKQRGIRLDVESP